MAGIADGEIMTKHICLITPGLSSGGAERVLCELANVWARQPVPPAQQPVKVSIIPTFKTEIFYEIDENIDVVKSNIVYPQNFIIKAINKIRRLFFVRRTCRRLRPDVVLSFIEHENIMVLLALLGLPMKKFVSDRNNPHMNIGPVNHWLRNRLYGKATGIIAQTSTAREVLSKRTGNDNIRVIPNPLRILRRTDVERKKIILNIGRYSDQKNQSELIDIFRQCRFTDDCAGSTDWQLKIIGEGPLRGDLQKQIDRLGLGDRVFLLDKTKNIDLHYSEASIFALTSLYEGFPNVLSEAMAHGLACIAYDCPTGPGEMIEDGINGYLVPLNHREEYVEKLTQLAAETLRREFGERAMSASAKYDLQTIANQYLNFILDGGTSPPGPQATSH